MVATSPVSLPHLCEPTHLPTSFLLLLIIHHCLPYGILKCVCVCVYLWKSQEDITYLFLSLSTWVCWAGSLWNATVAILAWLSNELVVSTCLYPITLALQAYVCLSFYLGSGNLNSSPEQVLLLSGNSFYRFHRPLQWLVVHTSNEINR